MINTDKIRKFAKLQTRINVKKIQTHFNVNFVEAKEIYDLIRKMEEGEI